MVDTNVSEEICTSIIRVKICRFSCDISNLALCFRISASFKNQFFLHIWTGFRWRKICPNDNLL